MNLQYYIHLARAVESLSAACRTICREAFVFRLPTPLLALACTRRTFQCFQPSQPFNGPVIYQPAMGVIQYGAKCSLPLFVIKISEST